MTFYMSHPMNWYEARRQMMRRMMNAEEGFDRLIRVPMQVNATENEYVVKALLPGMKAEDVQIEFTDSVLKVEGELKYENSEGENKLVDELPEGKFSRSFELSEAVDPDKIQASMSDGVLTIRVPKVPESKPRTIKINIK
ncbi:MAG TPA: molecular chaperone [Anaerolineaceae bacterium]|nr:molecular chaperone [Anaerolineaceae bacterium]